jgi:thiol-disulfide isomerase/thioredoxin
VLLTGPARLAIIIFPHCVKFNHWLVATALLLILSGIAALFWQQELQYARPTPVPANYVAVLPGERVVVPVAAGAVRKPVLLHFFNPDCPCSRFNLKHLKQLAKHYAGAVTFLAVVPEKFASQTEEIRRRYDLPMPVVADGREQLARVCGVYATPQAALVDTSGILYYRGNYNKSRYCTTPHSNYAQMAIDSLLAGTPSPTFGDLATTAYGCELPERSGLAGLKD